MSNSNGISIQAKAFREDFTAVAPLIREEWPVVEEEALTATEGEFEAVIALVAEKTEHTKVLVKRHLRELHAVSQKRSPKATLEAALSDVEARAREVLKDLGERGGDVKALVQDELVPKAESKVKENLLTSLLITLGFGFILGILFGRR